MCMRIVRKKWRMNIISFFHVLLRWIFPSVSETRDFIQLYCA